MKLIKKIKKIFNNENSKVVLKEKNRRQAKKRKSFKINLSFLSGFNYFKWKYIPYLLIFLWAFVLLTLFLVFGPFFTVKSIEIIRKDNITNMDISYKSMDYFRWEKMFKINEKDVLARFKDYQDNVKSIKLKLKLPSTLKIEVESYKEVFNVLINDNTYLLLENWTLVPWAHSKNLRLLNIVTEIDKNKFIEYKQIFKPIYIDRINTIIKRFEENFINVSIADLYYYESERELHINLEDGSFILFSIDYPEEIEHQIEKLAIFNKDYFSIDKSIFVYIDLRIKNKVFYCPIEIKNQCESNLKGIYSK